MRATEDGRGRVDLRFFGRTAAAVSHELKNGLAVMKEQVGLATDLLAMADRGAPLDPARLRDLLSKALRRLDQTDEVARDLNRLAHSVDEPRQVFDLSEAVELVARLMARFARRHGATVSARGAPVQVQIESDQFLVLELLSGLAEGAVEALGAATVTLSVEPEDGGARFVLAAEPPLEAGLRERLLAGAKPLCRALSARAAPRANPCGGISVTFPRIARESGPPDHPAP